jgi:hypothetical protein
MKNDSAAVSETPGAMALQQEQGLSRSPFR